MLKLLVGLIPGFVDVLQVAVLCSEAGVGAVALRMPFTTLAPAVVVPARELAFTVTSDVTQSRLDESTPEVLWQKNLEA